MFLHVHRGFTDIWTFNRLPREADKYNWLAWLLHRRQTIKRSVICNISIAYSCNLNYRYTSNQFNWRTSRLHVYVHVHENCWKLEKKHTHKKLSLISLMFYKSLPRVCRKCQTGKNVNVETTGSNLLENQVSNQIYRD